METNAQIKWDKEIISENGQTIKCKIDSNKGMNVIYHHFYLMIQSKWLIH